MDLSWWQHPESDRLYISIAQRWKTSLMNCRTYPGADCDTDHQLLVATVKVRLATGRIFLSPFMSTGENLTEAAQIANRRQVEKVF